MSEQNLPPKLQELLDDFQMIQDGNERADMLIYYADKFEPVPESIATLPYDEDHRVPACKSEAFVWSEPNDDGTLKYYFAVENPQGISAKAMAKILDETISGADLEKILEIEEDIIYKFFGQKLSMGKSAGLKSMLKVVKSHAWQELKEQDEEVAKEKKVAEVKK